MIHRSSVAIPCRVPLVHVMVGKITTWMMGNFSRVPPGVCHKTLLAWNAFLAMANLLELSAEVAAGPRYLPQRLERSMPHHSQAH